MARQKREGKEKNKKSGRDRDIYTKTDRLREKEGVGRERAQGKDIGWKNEREKARERVREGRGIRKRDRER